MPYHQAITDLVAARDAQGVTTIIVSLHSFTPSLAGVTRPWQAGVLYGGGREDFARAVLSALATDDLVVGDNLHYQFDETDFTVPRHAFASGRPYVELEIRQDMLETDERIDEMTRRLSLALTSAATTSGVR
jgi:predicted N-formylglutamate amidohydrolase